MTSQKDMEEESDKISFDGNSKLPFYFCFFLMQIHPDYSFPSFHYPSFPSALSLRLTAPVSFQTRAGLPLISTKNCITRCINTMHKSSYQGWKEATQ